MERPPSRLLLCLLRRLEIFPNLLVPTSVDLSRGLTHSLSVLLPPRLVIPTFAGWIVRETRLAACPRLLRVEPMVSQCALGLAFKERGVFGNLPPSPLPHVRQLLFALLFRRQWAA